MREIIPADPGLYENQGRFGRLPAIDTGDAPYRARTADTGKRRKMWTQRNPPLNQGNTPQCVIYSGDGWLTAFPVKNAGFGSAEKRTETYKIVQTMDEWDGEDYDGTSVRAMCKYLQSKGFIKNYGWATTADQVANHIINYSPMMFGFDWTEEMDRPDKNGYIWAKGRVLGGHAFYGIGADLDRKNPDGTKGAIRNINSWGNWGENGRFWMTLGTLDILLKGLIGWPGEAATATEVDIS